LQHLIYPWRALFLPALLLPLLAVFALERAGPRWSAALVLALVAINVAHTEPERYLTYDEEYYAPDSLAARGINTTTHEEFEPRWTDARPPYTKDLLAGISGPVEVTAISRRTASQEFLVKAPRRTQVESSTFFYPGWHIEIDGAPVAVSPVAVRGTMQFDVPAGAHAVKLELRPTPLRRVSLWVSALALALLAALVIRNVLRGHNSRPLAA
jgi:hypothetical protein